MSQGDILFFQAHTPPTFMERLIAWFTKSPIVHVGIDTGEYDGVEYMVEAIGQGIVEHPIGTRKFIRWSFPDVADDTVDMAKAIKWLDGEIGKRYGWEDVATAANLLQRFFYIVVPHAYNCATLTAYFLAEAGVDIGELSENVHLVTPARLFVQLFLNKPIPPLSG